MESNNEELAQEITDQIRALKDPRTRGLAVYELERRGKPAVKALLKALQHEKHGLRMGAAEALGKIGDRRAVTPLIRCLQEDENDFVRAKAAEALGRIGNQRAINPLIRALKDKAVRRIAARALIRIAPRRAVKPLLKEFRGRSPEKSQAAAEALELLELWVVLDLIKALPKESMRVRLWITEFVGKFGDWRAIEPLQKAIVKESDATVRAALRKARAKLEADQKW